MKPIKDMTPLELRKEAQELELQLVAPRELKRLQKKLKRARFKMAGGYLGVIITALKGLFKWLRTS